VGPTLVAVQGIPYSRAPTNNNYPRQKQHSLSVGKNGFIAIVCDPLVNVQEKASKALFTTGTLGGSLTLGVLYKVEVYEIFAPL
jgi:hypothetical protein